jgi:hypothetical protein
MIDVGLSKILKGSENAIHTEHCLFFFFLEETPYSPVEFAFALEMYTASIFSVDKIRWINM